MMHTVPLWIWPLVGIATIHVVRSRYFGLLDWKTQRRKCHSCGRYIVKGECGCR